jgi:hypothetical protein
VTPAAAPERLAYTGPLGALGGGVDTIVAERPDRFWDRVLALLQRAGFTIALLDERNGLLVATFQGDPSTYVDCGTIVAQAPRVDARARSRPPAARPPSGAWTAPSRCWCGAP